MHDGGNTPHDTAGVRDITSQQANKLKVLITRPAPENQSLCQQLLRQAWSPISLPLVTFDALDPPALPTSCPIPHAIIVVSPRAVELGLQWLDRKHRDWHPSQHTRSEMPPHWIAIGPATKAQLNKAHVFVHNTPEKSQNSETLLQEPFFKALPPKSQILIFKGEGGRTVIQSALTKQGHHVSCIDVYKRTLPSYTVQQLSALRPASADCFTVTSSEILQALVATLSESTETPDWLNTPILVVGQRQALDAKKFGFNNVFIAPGADNQTLIHTLNQWRATGPDHAT